MLCFYFISAFPSVKVETKMSLNKLICTIVLPADFLREDTLVGTSFLRVAAHDDDFGTNAVITYSMSLEQPEYLQVNPVTGWVYVNQPISQVSQSAVMSSHSDSPTNIGLTIPSH